MDCRTFELAMWTVKLVKCCRADLQGGLERNDDIRLLPNCTCCSRYCLTTHTLLVARRTLITTAAA